DVLDRPHRVEVLRHRHWQPGGAQLVDEPLQDVEQRDRRARGRRCGRAQTALRSGTCSSLRALVMSDWYLSNTCSVSPMTSGSMSDLPRYSSVRAQSMVSEIDGAFLSSSARIERTTRAIWSARCSSTAGPR